MHYRWHLHHLQSYLLSNNQFPFITSYLTHNGDCKIYMSVTWLANANQFSSIQSPMLTLTFSWRWELLLHSISSGWISFTPVTEVKQTIKTRMCIREITTMEFNYLLLCWLCEFWLWLLPLCKWSLNVHCHFLCVPSFGQFENWVSWKQSNDSDEQNCCG